MHKFVLISFVLLMAVIFMPFKKEGFSPCPDGYTLNTKTNKCSKPVVCKDGYKFDSRVGSFCMREYKPTCPDGSTFNSVNKMCVIESEPILTSSGATCPNDSKLNSVRKKCVQEIEPICEYSSYIKAEGICRDGEGVYCGIGKNNYPIAATSDGFCEIDVKVPECPTGFTYDPNGFTKSESPCKIKAVKRSCPSGSKIGPGKVNCWAPTTN